MENTKDLYVIINCSITGSGKSTVYQLLEEEVSDRFNIIYVSSDQHRKLMVDAYMEKNNCSRDEAFSKTGKGAARKFMEETCEKVQNEFVSNKVNILYVDKNFNQKTYTFVLRDLEKLSGFTLKLVVLVPKITKMVNKGFRLSWSYIIQCYFRIKGRTHETLDANSCPNFHSVLTMFAMSLCKLDVEALKTDERVNQVFEISYVDDSSPEINLSKEEADLFFGDKKTDSKENKAFFEMVEEKFGATKFEDTRETVRKEIKTMLSSL